MLKLQYFGNLMQRAKSLEKTLMLGKIDGRRRRRQQRMRWLDSNHNKKSHCNEKPTHGTRKKDHAATKTQHSQK